MTRFNRKTVLVGMSVVSLLAVGLVTVMIYKGPRVIYYTVLAEVTGVEVGTEVLYMGFPVGEVREIKIRQPGRSYDEPEFHIALAVEPNIGIPEGSVVKIGSGGLLDANIIYIEKGESARYLAAGANITARKQPTLTDQLEALVYSLRALQDEVAAPLLASMRGAIDSVGEIVDTDLRSLAGDLSRTSAQIADRTPELLNNVAETQSILRANLVRLEGVLSKIDSEQTELILTNLNRSSDDLQRLMSDLTITHRRLDTLLSTWTNVVADNKVEIDQSILDVSDALSALSQRAEADFVDLDAPGPTK